MKIYCYCYFNVIITLEIHRVNMKMWCSFVFLFKFYFSCKCLFIVTKCSEEINECVSSPRMSKTFYHKSPTIGQFVFLSLLFYTGWFCHQYYNPCELLNEPCKKKSTGLTLADGSHYCICEEGVHLCLFWCLFAVVTHEMTNVWETLCALVIWGVPDSTFKFKSIFGLEGCLMV